jgi:cyclophilin family peptidyl-prolyl cis-trans isomerase
METYTRKNRRNRLCRSLWIALVCACFVCALCLPRTGDARAGQTSRSDALLNPSALNEKAPDTFRANFDTTAGTFVVEAHRAWAPHGADRFYNLVKSGFYDGNRFYRVTPLMAVWGLNGDPAVAKAWLRARIPDDPTHTHGNTKGTVAFFQANKRTTQTFVNLVDNSGVLDIQIVPFGEVVSGMDAVEKLYAGYGEEPPDGHGPDLNDFYEEGNAYLAREFPRLDYISKATIVAP